MNICDCTRLCGDDPAIRAGTALPCSRAPKAAPARFTDAEYLNVDLFQGNDSELTCRSVKLVVTRKAHACHAFADSAPCAIAPGSRARHERARIDGSFWGSYYACLPCLKRTIAGDFDADDD